MKRILGSVGQLAAAQGALVMILLNLSDVVGYIAPVGIIVLVWIITHLNFEEGVRTGAVMYRSLTPAQKAEVDKLIDKEEADG